MTATILVMEDESAILAMTETMLRLFDYEVITASDGVEGLERFAESGDIISLVLVDLLMPRMNGAEVVERLRAQAPTLRIVLTTGHADDDEALAGLAVDDFLKKPFRMDQLKAIIERNLPD